MPDLLTELQSALLVGMPIKGITDNDIGRWNTGIVPQAMWEDAVVGALMRLTWSHGMTVMSDSTVTEAWVPDGEVGFESGSGPLPLLRAVRKAWEASNDQ